ncbi:MAG: choice-of-anchor D domain-containing protein [bacterium]
MYSSARNALFPFSCTRPLGNKSLHRARNRVLRFETMEEKDLLSVNPLGATGLDNSVKLSMAETTQWSQSSSIISTTPEIDVELNGENGVDFHDFGDVAVHETASETFTIRNEGSGVLQISQAKCIGQHANHFTFAPANPPGSSGDWELSSGANMQVSVTFAPDATGLREATLVFTSNDPDQPDYEIDLLGRGWGTEVSKLGPVSYRELTVPHPSADHDGSVYRFETARDGLLTFQAADDGGQSIFLGLYDWTGWLVSESATVGSFERLDQQVKQGETYYLKVISESPQVDVKVANLLNHQGTTVSVYGTPGDDSFLYDASTGRRIDINGIEYSADPATVTRGVADMANGSDTIVLDDSPGDDTLVARPDLVTASGPGYVFEGSNFDTLLVYARSGG